MELPRVLESWSWLAGIAGAGVAVVSAAWGIWASNRRRRPQGDWAVLDQAFHGIRIGARSATLQSLPDKPIARDGDGPLKLTKWRLGTGNNLSVTYDSQQDRILYAELDWDHKVGSAIVAVADLQFGISTLEQIRRKFGSNGFSYVKCAMFPTPEGIVTFNAFELKRTPSIIVVFISLLRDASSITDPGNDQQVSNEIGRHFKLVAVAVADEGYLDSIWGSRKIYDPTSTPIELDVR